MSKSRGKKKVKVTYKDCQIAHARKRAQERFDINLNVAHISYLVKLIKGQKVPLPPYLKEEPKIEFVGRQSLRISYFRVDLNDLKAIAVYDRKRGTIVSFLYEDWVVDKQKHT